MKASVDAMRQQAHVAWIELGCTCAPCIDIAVLDGDRSVRVTTRHQDHCYLLSKEAPASA